ncbi:unnamed protein product [Ilex paraguariensis]|uniref:C2H2-type domain-containing protein n=1 Tax=Ilex paraguariensis TaxID=185542 RepID=A0ABC8UVF3_9AQUA
MPVAKPRAANSLETMMKSEEGNDSLDTYIRQAIGKEPLLSFSRTGDGPVQWIQFLHALDQQDLPGWPLLTPLKIQMQKCDKCFREFCSTINYRRHIRVHRRSLNVDKESHKSRDLLAAFWDKLSLDEAKEVVSFNDVTLEEVPGSSIIGALMSFICKPGFCALPQVYVKAGSALLDVIQARHSRLPISSRELFTILDDASERTFLCAGTAESMQKYVFDGEAGKIGLEIKNLVACTSFLVEQRLVKAWLADKDAEALRCQKLLVEEEEAAQKRQAELLERKRQKKLRQKEQKAKEQSNGENAYSNITSDMIDSSPPAETSSPSALSESNSNALDIPDDVLSVIDPVEFSNKDEDLDIEAQSGFGSEHSESSTNQNAELQTMPANGNRHVVISRWQLPKSQHGGRNGFHGSQNLQGLKLEPTQKHGLPRGPRAALVNGSKVWTRKAEKDGESLRTRLHEEAMNQTDQNKCDVMMIGSISIPVRNCTSQQQGNSLAETEDDCSTEHTVPKKNNFQEKILKSDSVHCGTNRSAVKLWRPVSRHETSGPLAVQSSNREAEEGLISEKGDDGTVSNDSCVQSCAVDIYDSERENSSRPPLEENAHPEGLLFSSSAAKAFLAQRWKEAISADHVKLVLCPEPEPRGCSSAENDLQVVTPASEIHNRSSLGVAENRLADVEAVEPSVIGNAKAKIRTKPEKGFKIKYIPKQKTVT